MSEKLKTRSELMAELEEDAKVIRKHFGEARERVIIYERVNARTLRIDIDDCDECDNGDVCGNEFEYLPDQVAPAKGRTVLSGNGRFWVSAGELDGDMLRVFNYSEEDNMDYISHWCDYFNRDHHSPGWKKEWEPDYIQNKEDE